MADARPRRVEVHALLRGERLNVPVFPEVGLRRVLDVVVKSKDRLPGVADGSRADRGELLHHRRGVVMGHHVPRPKRDHVPGPEGAVGSLHQVCLGDPLDGGLGHRPFSFAHPLDAWSARARAT